MLVIKIITFLIWLGFGGLFWRGVEKDIKIHKHFASELEITYSRSTYVYFLIYLVGVFPVSFVLLILK